MHTTLPVSLPPQHFIH